MIDDTLIGGANSVGVGLGKEVYYAYKGVP